ncbi:hypothetical protein FOXG_12611 [Fusarium oxysporum f. sp. lycopersici 4287]|uniref:Uncharacterized protein n=1 Tax=Fusarium oxysporum f. sp. lycopersici (strain 4287 / CBS 123668 / FGSC 9935 / NRRL 34936) TaxID=426428 RepID=A0A0J9VTJ6_FUSO4|nr:hypothetical protein FOXG_12611 [Fusarium oxysporum f. sp. lycopersici 4287]KNB14086.1 hypothetical protein FOXG_12611 [Fusarium oxysporum f. sp. lycopersici 4287]
MGKYPLKELSSEVDQFQKGLIHLTGSVADHQYLIKTIGNWKRSLEITVWFRFTSDQLRSRIVEANHTNRLRNLFVFIYQETEIKKDDEEQRKRNPVIRSELKKFGLIELVFLGITLTVLQIKHLTDDEIKFIHEFLRQCIENNHLEPYLRQERFVTAIKNAHVIDLVEQDFSDFQKFKKDIEARNNELASKKRKKVSDNDPVGESLRASSVSADVADDDNTCCFHHFLASLGSAEDEETSLSSHLPQIQTHVQQPASDESHIENCRSEEDSHSTTDLGRKGEDNENVANEGDIYAAQPSQKRAKTVVESHAEAPIAGNTGKYHQERPTPNVGHLTSVTQAIDYLNKKMSDLLPIAVLAKPIPTHQYSSLVFFPPKDEAFRNLFEQNLVDSHLKQKPYQQGIEWKDIPQSAEKVWKDRGKSLEIAMGTIGSLYPHAALAILPDLPGPNHLRVILYQDMTMFGALDELPTIHNN